MTLYFVLILGPLTACLLQLATSLHVSNANFRVQNPSATLRQLSTSLFSQKIINSVSNRHKTTVNLSRNHLTALKASSSSGKQTFSYGMILDIESEQVDCVRLMCIRVRWICKIDAKSPIFRIHYDQQISTYDQLCILHEAKTRE